MDGVFGWPVALLQLVGADVGVDNDGIIPILVAALVVAEVAGGVVAVGVVAQVIGEGVVVVGGDDQFLSIFHLMVVLQVFVQPEGGCAGAVLVVVGLVVAVAFVQAAGELVVIYIFMRVVLDDVDEREQQQQSCHHVGDYAADLVLHQVVDAFPAHACCRHQQRIGEEHMPPAAVDVRVFINNVEYREEE